MDIVIPYWEDRLKDTELKYALRSMEKYLTGFGNIWVIGAKPQLKEINHIPCGNTDRKEFNIANKMLTACNSENISDPFLMWHDDHFLLKPIHVKDIKYWYDGTLQQAYDITRSSYKKVIRNAIDHGCLLNFDIHTPIIFEKKRFVEKVMSANWKLKEYCVKSLYCNGMEGEQMDDLKINLAAYEPFIREKIKDRLFFSTGPLGMQPEMINVLNELYPEKSKYEL